MTTYHHRPLQPPSRRRSTMTAAPCHKQQQQQQVHPRDRIPTMVFSPVLTSDSSQPLKPSLARDLSYGDQEELTRKLNDFYWYANAVPTASLLQQQQQQQTSSQTDDQQLLPVSYKCKAQARTRANSAELGRQMKIGVIPALQEDVEKELLPSVLKKAEPPIQKSSSISRRLSKLFLLPSRKIIKSTSKSTRPSAKSRDRRVRFAE
jgi:hypothetical protein